MKKHTILFILIGIILLIVISRGFNTSLETTSYTYTSSKLPDEFNDYTIAFLSDLHCKNFGEHQSDLIQMVTDIKPDLIVLTGDIVDEDHTDLTPVEDLFQGISNLAPTYYINGNHELNINAITQYSELLQMLKEYNIIDLNEKSDTIYRGNSHIVLRGQRYRAFYIPEYLPYADTSKFNILLYHGSDNFNLISSYGYDLVLSGHTHGGLVRLPFIGGVFGNNGSLFPKYDSGTFTENNSTLICNRGLGDGKLPRFYNRPEVIKLVLKCD